jgi:hypothetical protein
LPKIELDDKHIYRVDGREVPANTRILEDQGLIDLDGIPRDRLAYKSALGTAVHYAIHLHETHNLDEKSLHPEIAQYFQAYKKFSEVFKFEPRHTELMLYSKIWGFCTTLDLQGPFVWNKKEIEAILEIKCSWNMRAANAIQTAAQQIAFEENYPDIKIRGRFGLQLKGTGNYDVFEYNNPRDKNTFLSALTCHRWRIDNGLINKEN